MKKKKKALHMKKLFFLPPFQTNCTITTNCATLEKQLRLKYGSYLSNTPAPTHYSISALRTENGYTVQTPVGTLQSDTALYEIDHFLFERTVYDPHIWALHGAAVEWNKQCHLFLAATTSGKTTLTSYLCSNGFGYLTDDCILLDRQSLCVHPYATPLQLRRGGVEVLTHYDTLPTKMTALEEGSRLERLVYTPSNVPQRPVPLASIFFMERTENENALIEMNATERITALMQAPITNYAVTGEYLRFLSGLSQKAPCYRLRYYDMNYVKELIQNG